MGTKHQIAFEVEKGRKALIRRREVERVTGLSRSSIYARMSTSPPTFPLAVDCGGRVVAWVESEIQGWVEDRIACRDRNQSVKAGSVQAERA